MRGRRQPSEGSPTRHAPFAMAAAIVLVIQSVSPTLAITASGSSGSSGTAQRPLTADEIMDAMDRNRNYTTIAYTGTMEIHLGDEVRSKTMKTLGVGDQKALVEFVNPEDQGVKYLKLKKDLWIYFPSEQDVVKISGHMLKEGMMGSDVSYEDALEADALRAKYAAAITREEPLDNQPCYVLTLEAKVKDAPYYKRIVWVDKQTYIPRKEEMYAKSGKLLKENRVLEVKKIGSRVFPTRMEMTNKLRANSRTVFEMKDIAFDVKVGEGVFSLQNLQR